MEELNKAKGKYPQYDAYLETLKAEFSDLASLEYRARSVVEKLALAWQASTLILFGDPLMAQAYVASRITGYSGNYYGTLPTGIDVKAIIERARPRL